MLKRIVCLIALSAVVASLIGCGDKKEDAAATGTSAGTEKAAGGTGGAGATGAAPVGGTAKMGGAGTLPPPPGFKPGGG